MTQPAVTFQVRQLEEHFKTRLFDRTHTRVALTDAGRLVYNYAERIFALYDEMENRMRDMTGDLGGVLTVGASTTVAEYMLPALLGKFKAAYPDITLSLKVSNSEGIVSMVESNVIDLGVVEAPVNNKQLAVTVCFVDQLVVAIPPDHPLASQTAVKPEELCRYPFICREEGSGTREVIMEYLTQNGGGSECLEVCLELGSPEAIKGAVEAGMGISILSNATLRKELRLGTLCSLPLDPPLERPFSFVRQRQIFRHRATEELLKFAQNYLGNPVEPRASA